VWLCLFSVSLWFPYSLVDSHNLYVPLGQDKGYGFIGNDELKQRFNGMDVFLQTNQKRHFEQGDFVAFSVFKNKRGQPQATELRAR